MRHIKVYMNTDSIDFVIAALYYQFYLYHRIPYILLDDLRTVHPNSIGLFLINVEKQKIA